MARDVPQCRMPAKGQKTVEREPDETITLPGGLRTGHPTLYVECEASVLHGSSRCSEV